MFLNRKKMTFLLIFILIFTSLPINSFVYAVGVPEITDISLIATTTKDGSQSLMYQIYGKNFDNPTFWIDGRPVDSNKYEVVDGAYLIISTPDNNDFFEGGKTHTFTVQNSDGQESEEVQFTVAIVPWVTSISTSKVYIGDSLTIYGTGLDDTTNPIEKVIIGGNPYTSGEFRIESAEGQAPKIVIDSVKPAQFPRDGDVKIVKRSSEGYEIQGIYKSVITVVGKLQGVEVDRIEPNAGPVNGGTTIRILGEEGYRNFTSDMKIYVDKVDENNKLSNIELILDDDGNVIGISGIVPESPTGNQGVFSIIITDNTGANELIVENGFTYEDKDNLLKLLTISPSYAKGGSSDPIEITGRNIITLNLPNLVDWTVNEAVYDKGSYYDYDKNSLITNYLGKYRVSDETQDYNVNITRETKLILGVTTEMDIVDYSAGLDKITAKVPIVGEPGPATVTIQTTTTVRDINTNELIFSRNEEYSLENGFTFLPATTIPTIESIEPERGSIDDLIYLTIRGSNFQVLIEPNPNYDPNEEESSDNPKTITKYPIIKIGNKIINPNEIDADDINAGYTYNPDWIKVYDDDNNEVNGVGRVIGSVIKTVIPAHGDKSKIGLVDVRITNPDLGEIFVDKSFEFTKHSRAAEDLPEITKIIPSMGPIEGGNTIIIQGRNFDYQEIKPNVIVTIDGIKAKVVTATSTKIEAIVPKGVTIGDKPVQVITEDGAIATKENGYTYIRLVANPQIESIAPAFGGKGTVVYIFGKDKGPEEPNFFAPDPSGPRIEDKIGTRVFLNDIDINDKEEYDDEGNLIAGSVYRKINGEITADENGNVFEDQSRVEVIDRNTLRVVIPGGYSPGIKKLTILNPDTSFVTIDNGFNYKIPPDGIEVKINSIMPDYGSHTGGMYVTIEGENFKDGAKVYFGGKEATDVNVSGNRDRIFLRTPEYRLPNPDLEPSKKVDVTIVNYDGSNVTLENGYEYMVPESEPVINKINPSIGTTIGNEYVSIQGIDFRKYFDTKSNTYKYPEVYFGGEKSKEVIYISDTELYVKTPFHGGEGSVDVTVINPDAGTYIKENGFTYRMTRPIIEDVIPNRGSKQGGQEIAVKGKELLQGDFSEELNGEKLNGEDPIINVLAIFGDEKDEDKVILDKAENILGDVRVDYEKDRTLVELWNGETTSDSLLIYHKDIEKPIAHYNIQPDERHLFIIDWKEILGGDIGAEGILVELRDETLTSKRRIAPKAEVVDAVGEDGTKTVYIQTPPTSVIGKKNLYIENKDRGWSSTEFEYLNPSSRPTIETITPRSEILNEQDEIVKYYVESTVEGGLYITIEGYDLRQDVEIFIDGTPATVISRVVLSEVDDEGRPKTRLVVKAPKGRVEDINKEMRIIIVNQDGGFIDASLLPIPYYFVYRIPESRPYIESILPAETSQAGGNKIRIVGYDFRSGAKVLIGGKECSVDFLDNDEIVIITPTDLTPGLKDVQIVNVDHGAVTKNAAITVVSYPEIIAVTTENGQTINRVSIEGGQKIALSGRNFRQGARVFFGGTRKIIGSSDKVEGKGLFKDDKYYEIEGAYEAQKVEFISEYQMIVTIPEVFKEADYTITILNPDGGLSDNNKTLDYRVPIPSDPVGLEAEIVNDKYIRIYGYSSSNASYYEIYAYLGDDYPDDRDFKYLDTTEKTSYKITKFKDIGKDEDIYLRIRAVNKYGPSEWSNIVKIPYSELDDIDRIGDEDKDGDISSNYQESIAGGEVNVVLGNKGLRGSEYNYYIIDLKDSKYKNIEKRTINIPGKIIKESSRVILVDNGDSRLQFTPRNFYTYQFYSKSSSEQNDTYGQIMLEKIKGPTSDYLERKVPRKYKLLSKIYDLQTKLQTRQYIINLDNISGSMDLELRYDENRLIGIDENKLQIFKFDPENGKWIPLAGGIDKERNVVYGRIYGPGHYAILGEK